MIAHTVIPWRSERKDLLLLTKPGRKIVCKGVQSSGGVLPPEDDI